MTSPLETFKGIFMVMTTRNLISLALMVHSTYLQMAQMMKMMLWVMVRMDGSLSHLTACWWQRYSTACHYQSCSI